MVVSVHGIEYAFGAHEYSTSGIFESEPKKCQEFTFRKSILIGWTDMKFEDVRRVMEEELASVYIGTAYNLITKNCNHFCNDACIKLTGNPIPSWVNRLARLGNFCLLNYENYKFFTFNNYWWMDCRFLLQLYNSSTFEISQIWKW